MVKRPPGRPPLDDSATAPSASVHLRIAAADYDKADKLARQHRESIQATIRRALKRFIETERCV